MTIAIDGNEAELESVVQHNLEQGDWDTPMPDPWIKSLVDEKAIAQASTTGKEFVSHFLK